MQFSTIRAIDAETNGGNRFDVPGGSVLYAATRAEGGFAETVARMRPSPAMKLLEPERDEHFMNAGSVPAEWRTVRRLVRFGLKDPLPFVDVDATGTHTFLMQELAGSLAQLGASELDVSIVRSNNRLLTRAIARWAYTAANEDGDLMYSGIRFGSRLGDYELWAIFDGTDVADSDERTIERDDPYLAAVAADFDLTIH